MARYRTPRSDETRNRLLDAGRALFAANGYDGVGIRDIAARAGVKAALIQYHFGGKEGLLNDILLRDLAFAAGATGLAVERTLRAADKLGAFIQAVARVARRRPWFPSILLRELLAGGARLQPGVRQRVSDFLNGPRAIVEADRGTRDLGDVDWRVVALTFAGMLASLALAGQASEGWISELFDPGLQRPPPPAKVGPSRAEAGPGVLEPM